MKQLLTTVLLALASSTMALAAPDGASRIHRAPTVTGDGTTLYGEVTFSDAMNTPTADKLAWGLYSFDATSPMTVTPITIHNTLCANGGGAYRKGKLYFTSYYQDMTGSLGYLYFIELNLADNSIERHALTPDTYDAIAADMAYDPVGDKLYGVSFDRDDYNLATYVLVDYNISTGYPTVIASIDRMSAIACDNMGQLWGVRYKDGKLVKIDKQTAAVTEVGSTGVNPIYNGSACFDFKTGKLYWATNERSTEKSGLYQIDVTTGAAGLISMFPDDESISALYIPQADDIELLNPVTDIRANFEGSSLDGSISFTAPSTAKDGTPLTGDVTVSGYVDGALSFSIPVKPGAVTTRNFSLTQGTHSIEIVAVHPTAGRSPRAKLDFYVGSDGPAAVTDLTLTRASDTSIRLNWTAPTAGEHGGSINTNLVYYRIERLPDHKVLTDDCTGNSYTDANINPDLMRRYSYIVTGYYKNIEGASVTSDELEMGKGAALPFLQTFDTMADYATFVVRNDNPDPTRPDEGLWGWFEEKKCAAYKYHTLLPGDDWLITPGFELKKGQIYRLKFKSMGGRYYPEALEIKMGRGYSKKEMNQTLLKRTEILSPNQTMEEREINFSVEEDGNYYIGFHAVTPKGQYWLYIDDVAVEAGPAMAAPGNVTGLSIVPGSTADAVDITFTAPGVDLFGNKLDDLQSVKVFRDNTLVKELKAADGVGIGKEVKFTDKGVPTGKHVYTLKASNANGDGHAEESEVYAGLDIPKGITTVTHTTADGKTAQVSWDAATEGANGGSIAYETVKYRITDHLGNLVAENVEGTSYTHTTIDTKAGQRNMVYVVAPYNSTGEGEGKESGFITYGEAYKNAFAESFAGGVKPTTSDWIMQFVNPSPYDNGFYGRYFSYRHKPNDKDRGPIPEAQDKDGGMLVAYTDYIDVEARMISPKINVEGVKNPVLSFWFYHYYNPDLENGYSTEKEYMNVEAYVNGEFKLLTEKPILLINGTGWYRYDIPLKEAVGADDFQIAFRTHNYISYDMHVDNITVHDVADNDLQLTSFTLPSQISVNSTRKANVKVFNYGIKPAEGYSVELYKDGKLFATKEAEAPLEFAKEITFSFEITPSITEAGKASTYSAKIVFDKDENLADNVSEEITSHVPGNTLPKVTDLKGSAADSKVTLSWSEPDMTAAGVVTDGFESYEPFTITKFGGWTLVDLDGSLTYTISNSSSASGDYEYPNAGYQMAFQAFNPAAAGIKGQLWTPYLGEQMAVCFAAAERSNDDWLISPEVKPGSKVSFMAKSVVDSYGLEKFNFCYSTEEEVKVADFKQIGETHSVPAKEWTKYEFTLPADARRFAINCVSTNSYAFLLDEVTYEGASADVLEFRGYNIYRDGERLNNEIVEENEFTDLDPKAEGVHVYNVTAIYDKGESCLSNDASVDLSGVGTLKGNGMTVRTSAGLIEILNADDTDVAVFNLQGIMIFNETVGDYARLSVEPGVYLIRSEERMVKVIVK